METTTEKKFEIVEIDPSESSLELSFPSQEIEVPEQIGAIAAIICAKDEHGKLWVLAYPSERMKGQLSFLTGTPKTGEAPIEVLERETREELNREKIQLNALNIKPFYYDSKVVPGFKSALFLIDGTNILQNEGPFARFHDPTKPFYFGRWVEVEDLIDERNPIYKDHKAIFDLLGHEVIGEI